MPHQLMAFHCWWHLMQKGNLQMCHSRTFGWKSLVLYFLWYLVPPEKITECYFYNFPDRSGKETGYNREKTKQKKNISIQRDWSPRPQEFEAILRLLFSTLTWIWWEWVNLSQSTRHRRVEVDILGLSMNWTCFKLDCRGGTKLGPGPKVRLT